MSKIKENNFSCRVFNLELINDKNIDEKLLTDIFSNNSSTDKLEIALDKVYKKFLDNFIKLFQAEFDNKVELTVVHCARSYFKQDGIGNKKIFDVKIYGIISPEIITNENIISNIVGRLVQNLFNQQQNSNIYVETKIKN